MPKKILLVTNEEDPHADIVIKLLGSTVFRLNTESILKSFSISALLDSTNKERVYLENSLSQKLFLDQISSLYYRRPEKPAFKKEFSLSDIQIGEAWGALFHFLHSLNHVPWMGHPFFDKINSSRILQLRTAKKYGFKIPDTLISRKIDEIHDFLKKHNKVAIKPIHERGKTVNGFWTPYFTEVRFAADILSIGDDILTNSYNYMQEYIEKKREWRVTVVGDKIFPCVIESQKNKKAMFDWRMEDVDNLEHYYEPLPENIVNAILNYMKKLNLNFGAIDLIETTSGEWCFLECNPNGQWLWIELKTKMKISEAIAKWHQQYL
jgi:glutathione synthase/RimK-type ligase-like ATP-grasp enzyme